MGRNVSFVAKLSKNSANSLLVAPPKPSEAFRAFHDKNTDGRSLIWRTEPDKRGLPFDGFAIDRHFTFYFAALEANIYINSMKESVKSFP